MQFAHANSIVFHRSPAGVCVRPRGAAQGAATWIWSPGDVEVRLSNPMQVQRVERDVAWPPFWRLYSHQPQVNFMRQADLAEPEDVDVAVDGVYNVALDRPRPGMPAAGAAHWRGMLRAGATCFREQYGPNV